MLNIIKPFCPGEIFNDAFVLWFYDCHLHNSISLKGNITAQFNTWQRLLARTTPTHDPLMSCRQTFCFISYLPSWTKTSLLFTRRKTKNENIRRRKKINRDFKGIDNGKKNWCIIGKCLDQSIANKQSAISCHFVTQCDDCITTVVFMNHFSIILLDWPDH